MAGKMEMPADEEPKDDAELANEQEALGFSEQIARLTDPDKALITLLVERFNSADG